MSNAASRRSTMTLFSHSNNIYSHQVRIVLAEKGVQYDLVEVWIGILYYTILPSFWNIWMKDSHTLR